MTRLVIGGHEIASFGGNGLAAVKAIDEAPRGGRVRAEEGWRRGPERRCGGR